MDLVTIITLIGTALTSGIAGFFINPRAAWRKPEIDNKSTEATTDQTKTQTATDAMSAMQETITKQVEANQELFVSNASLQKENGELKSDLIQCSSAICRVGLCPLREPEKGRGDEVFAEAKENKTSLFDNTDFEEFAYNKGYAVKKLKKINTEQ